ncbi:hypothetical protein LLH06_14080 [Mucilaginibacter daejeonensis]|uniref:hypothetical protein n=1 Tax=Mucilaginibacter daejeonensis TaxID=398049 RepID=UPI001D179D24|nr:hypothetical protein [Mucilaginibacter daejeonensis]UEG52090.1 hypothetical protein LLH06_14080 [Mucilaginibacter daejeonensis]
MFKYSFIVAAAVFFLSSCGQKMKMVATEKNDSLAVDNVWKQYVGGVKARNPKLLKKLSLPQVYCQPCAIRIGGGDLVNADVFVKDMLTNLPKTKLWEAVRTSRYLMVTERIKNYKPLNLDVKSEALDVYDVWYVTKVPTTMVKGYESQRYAFQFVKDKGQYKLFGLTAVN